MKANNIRYSNFSNYLPNNRTKTVFWAAEILKFFSNFVTLEMCKDGFCSLDKSFLQATRKCRMIQHKYQLPSNVNGMVLVQSEILKLKYNNRIYLFCKGRRPCRRLIPKEKWSSFSTLFLQKINCALHRGPVSYTHLTLPTIYSV